MECDGSEWRQLAQAVLVLDRDDCIVYAEYVADQLRESDYATALQAVELATVE
jgi:hypothetical protein